MNENPYEAPKGEVDVAPGELGQSTNGRDAKWLWVVLFLAPWTDLGVSSYCLFEGLALFDGFVYPIAALIRLILYGGLLAIAHNAGLRQGKSQSESILTLGCLLPLYLILGILSYGLNVLVVLPM
jgi:hypothetical protein